MGLGVGEQGSDELAGGRGAVVAAFSGDEDVAAGQGLGQAGQFGDPPGAFHHARAPCEAEPRAPGSTDSGLPGVRRQHLVEDLGIVGECGVELGDLGRARALLRAEQLRGAVRAVEHRAGVGEQLDPAGGRGEQPGDIDAVDVDQGSAPVGYGVAVPIEQFEAEPAQCPGAPVGGGRATQRDGDTGGAGFDRSSDGHAEPTGVRAGGVRVLQHGQPADLGEFDDGGVVGQDEPAGRYGGAVRSGNERTDVPAGSGHGRLADGRGALAPVGLGQEHDLVTGAGSAPTRGQRGGYLDGGGAALERIGSDEHAQRVGLVARVGPAGHVME
nr:hypothetical protein [Pseudonocardia sp. C8]